jgi:hypothetical protein
VKRLKQDPANQDLNSCLQALKVIYACHEGPGKPNVEDYIDQMPPLPPLVPDGASEAPLKRSHRTTMPANKQSFYLEPNRPLETSLKAAFGLSDVDDQRWAQALAQDQAKHVRYRNKAAFG